MIHVGCAGWSLPTAASERFPGQGSHLERYARVLSSVEINTSFYRPHQPKTYARWAASVPDTFRFSVKMPKMISHELRLRGTDDALRRFMDEVGALGEKLGCLLLQLPPSLLFDEALVVRFFAQLRQLTHVRVACEPRHASWFTPEAVRVLRDADVACVLADPPPVAGTVPLGSPSTLYIRLHGSPRVYYSSYDDAFVRALTAPLLRATDAGLSVWCIFDNTAGGEAVPNALALVNGVAAVGRTS